MTSLLPTYIATLGKKIDMAEQAKDPSCSFEHSITLKKEAMKTVGVLLMHVDPSIPGQN